MLLAVQQFIPEFGAVEANRRRLIAALEATPDADRIDLVVLPELIVTGYRFRDRAELERLAEPIPGARRTPSPGTPRVSQANDAVP